jgi:hypothetical protein
MARMAKMLANTKPQQKKAVSLDLSKVQANILNLKNAALQTQKNFRNYNDLKKLKGNISNNVYKELGLGFKDNKKSKFKAFDNIEELLKADSKKTPIEDRINQMMYTTAQYIGPQDPRYFEVLNVNSGKGLTDLIKSVQNNKVTAITENTGKEIVKSNKLIVNLLQRISDDMVNEQDHEKKGPEIIIQQEKAPDYSSAFNSFNRALSDMQKSLENQQPVESQEGLLDKGLDYLMDRMARRKGFRLFRTGTKSVAKAGRNIIKSLSSKSGIKNLLTTSKFARSAPWLSGALKVADLGMDVYNIESGITDDMSRDEVQKRRGSGYARVAVEGAGAAIGGALGSFLGPLGTAAGIWLGSKAASMAMDTKAGKWLEEKSTQAFKWSDDNDIMEDLDKKGVISYNRLGSSKILDRSAIQKLSKDEIQKLIDFDDFSGSDLKYLKGLLDGTVEAQKSENDTFAKVIDLKKEEISQEIQKLQGLHPDFSKEIYEAYQRLQSADPASVIGSNTDIETIRKLHPKLAELIRENAYNQIKLRARGLSQGISFDDMNRKYKIGKYSNVYTVSDPQIAHVEEQQEEKRKSSEAALDHIAEYDNSDNAYLDSLTAKYETVLDDSQRYTGSVRLVGGKALATSATQCLGPYVNHKARGIRNNNPGNIRISNEAWLGKIPLEHNTDKSFEQFTYAEYGIRALAVNLKNYQIKHNLYTVQGMITRFAPSVENNTSSYVSVVSRALNVSPNDNIDFSNPDIALAMLKAIILHENGDNPYPDDLILRAYNAALGRENLELDEAAGVTTAYDNSSGEMTGENPGYSSSYAPSVESLGPQKEATVDASEITKYANIESTVNLSKMKPEYMKRLASAAKTYYEMYKKKINITSGYRSSHEQASLYLRKALGDTSILTVSKPMNDESFRLGEVIKRVGTLDAMKAQRAARDGNIVFANGVVTVKGSGNMNKHALGLAVDVSRRNLADFAPIARQFGLVQPFSRDPVHFEMADGIKTVPDDTAQDSSKSVAIKDEKPGHDTVSIEENKQVQQQAEAEVVQGNKREVTIPRKNTETSIVVNNNSVIQASEVHQSEGSTQEVMEKIEKPLDPEALEKII